MEIPGERKEGSLLSPRGGSETGKYCITAADPWQHEK
jgi:hypothetical protein